MTTLPGTQHLATSFLDRFPMMPEPATWTCETCGVIEPKKITTFGDARYIKQECTCQIAEKKRQEQEKIRQNMQQGRANRIYSWLGGRWSDLALRTKTFENFNAARQPEAVEVTKLFLEQMSGTLVLYGTFGTGKTHLLAAICNALCDGKRVESRFVTSPKLFSAIQGHIAAKEDYSSIITSAMRTPLLVIDDIDKAKWTEFREEIYFEIIDERVKAGKPTAISTNRLDALADFVGGAVCSRFKVGQIAVEMIGTDYREEI